LTITQSLIRRARAFLGTDAGPKAKFSPWLAPETEAEDYEGMDKNYREYRRCSLVRRSINILASWTTKKGFQTVLEPIEAGMKDEEKKTFLEKPEYVDLKNEIDRINKAVNLDWIIRVAEIKRKVYGKCGFEIVLDNDEKPRRLIPLKSTELHPKLDEDWELEKFEYPTQDRAGYAPEQILYFVNEQIEGDMLGLSAIEPVLDSIQTRQKIIREDLKEAASTLWAGVAIAQVDTSGLTDAEADAAVQSVVDTYKPGKILATNLKTKFEVVDIKPDLEKLVKVLADCNDEIIGNFEVPRFLLNRLAEINRATAFAQLKAFAEGPVDDIQRYFKREIERQWYDPLTRLILKTGEKEEPPVTVKHVWSPLTTEDIIEWINTVTNAYKEGMGFIDRKKAYQILQPFGYFDPAELEAE